jgi:hypothetical protein
MQFAMNALIKDFFNENDRSVVTLFFFLDADT